MIAEGSDSVAEAESAVLESLSRYGSCGLGLELIISVSIRKVKTFYAFSIDFAVISALSSEL